MLHHGHQIQVFGFNYKPQPLTTWTFHSQCSCLSQYSSRDRNGPAINDNSFVALDTDIHTVTAFCSLLVFTGTEKGCQLSPVEAVTIMQTGWWTQLLHKKLLLVPLISLSPVWQLDRRL